MLEGRVPLIPHLEARWKNRRADVIQRRVAIALARKLPGIDGIRRFSLRLYLPFGRPRVYRLKGYAPLKKASRKLHAARAQRSLWRVLFIALIVIFVAYFLLRVDPFRNMAEILRMIGIQP